MLRKRTLFTTLLVVALVLTVAPSLALAQAGLRADAVVLVNTTSASYIDFEYYIQPYLDNFGVPYTVLDISSTAVGANLDQYALIIVGHRQLDTGNLYLDNTEEGYISAAVAAGTGLVNFDNDLSADGSTPRYGFVDSIFDFGYATPSSGSGVTFVTPGGPSEIFIDCTDNGHQDPVLETFTDSGLLDPDDGAWDEFWHTTGRPFAAVFATTAENPEVMNCFDTSVPDGEYQVFASLYTANAGRDLTYYYGYTPGDPQAHSVDTVGGSGGSYQFTEHELTSTTVSGGQFDIYFEHGVRSGGTNDYMGWYSIRLVPEGVPSSPMHYITERHEAGELIDTGSMTLAGITLPEGVTPLATTGNQPFLAVTTSGQGRAVQWGTYDWMSATVKGAVYGLDDLVWRSIVWAARKPFVMQALPPFLTMRVDDVSEPHMWVDVAIEHGLKPWLGVFLDDMDATESAHLSTLTHAGDATVSIHGFSYNHWFYRDRSNNRDYTEQELDDHFALGLYWHQSENIPIAKYVVAHHGEISIDAVPRLNDWGIEFIGTMPDLGQPWESLWTPIGPYRHDPPTPRQMSSAPVPFYYADYMTVPGHPEWGEALFNCVSEVRDYTNYEWYPDNDDVPGSISRATLQLKREFDSLVLPTLFTHEQHLVDFTEDNWRAVLQGVTENVAAYDPIYVTMDHACQYARAIHTSNITSSSYDPLTRHLTTVLGGETDMPTQFYLFREDAGVISYLLIDVPQFSGSTQVDFTLPGPLHHIAVSPGSATVATGGSQQFSAQGYDADDNPIPGLSYDWGVENGGGTVDASGTFTAGLVPGTYADTVAASVGGITGYASVEVVAPALDHFTFDTIASPQYVGTPFEVVITARDVSGNRLTGYNDQATLSDTTGTIDPTLAGPFVSGVWTGTVTIDQPAIDVVISAQSGAISSDSNLFDVQAAPSFYTVSSDSHTQLEGVPFEVTVTGFQTRINCWEDDHQNPVMETTEDTDTLNANYAAGLWTEYLHRPSRDYPDITASALHTTPLSTMEFYANGIADGRFHVIANLYDSAPMRYFYGYTSGDPSASYVDTIGGLTTGTQHREYSLGTVDITGNAFDLYVNDAELLDPEGYEGFGWAWIRLEPFTGLETTINVWENDHQDPTLPTVYDSGALDPSDNQWDEFHWDQRDYPGVFAGVDETPPVIRFYAPVPNGTYHVSANLYHSSNLRYYYGFDLAQPRAYSVEVDSGPAGDFAYFDLGTVTVTDGEFALYTDHAEIVSNDVGPWYGWAHIRLSPAVLTLSSSSPTMVFDGDEDGIFGEPGDNLVLMVDNALTITARDSEAGTGVTITASDNLGQSGSYLYNIEEEPTNLTLTTFTAGPGAPQIILSSGLFLLLLVGLLIYLIYVKRTRARI